MSSRSSSSSWTMALLAITAIALAGAYGLLLIHDRSANAAAPVLVAQAVPANPAASSASAAPNSMGGPQPAMPRPSDPLSNLDSSFALSVDITRPHLPAELIVLPSRAPVVLRAEIKPNTPLPESYRETKREYHWSANFGKMLDVDSATSPGETIFMAPEASELAIVKVTVDLSIEHPGLQGKTETSRISKTAQLQLLTPVSSEMLKDGKIDGYDIGHYLDPKRSSDELVKTHPSRYQVPEGFYKVTQAMKPLKIAPDMSLGFWLIDFPWKSLGETQYIALDMHLVEKLHDLAEMMRADGHKITEFKPIYGFRPPFFNMGKIESEKDSTLKAVFSMHQYGRAADIIIDENNDNIMDDLNGDGKIDVNDARVILKYVDRLDRQYIKQKRMDMVGGAGIYTHTDFLERAAAIGQTPYVHIDTRGYTSGGDLVRWMDKNLSIDDAPDGAKKPAGAAKQEPSKTMKDAKSSK